MTIETAAGTLGERPATQEELAAMIVSSFVSHNSIQSSELPGLYTNVLAAVSRLTTSDAPAPAPVDQPSKAEIKKSITPDALISFIDGRGYKTLRRHLTKHGLSPESYRERFGLPGDYPLVAASYSDRRAALAREIGLGSARRSAST